MLFRNFITGFVLLMFLYTAAGCGSGSNKILSLYNNYPFDTAVIEKLPVYDSLAAAISEKLPVLLKAIDTNEAYQAFRYMPASFETGVFAQLPPEAGTKIGQYCTALGANFFAGFDLFKDSTIKIYIRRLPVDTAMLDIEENLSYYPAGENIRTREFPVKDTVLNQNWQYWIRFNERGLF